MKKIILIGRVAAGKTTLTQALRGEEIKYYKTQYVNYLDTVIDTPGEYTGTWTGNSSYMIFYMFQCHSPKSSHPLPLPQIP